ncbi:methyltransferase domain-containing protein [Clostridium sp.]|uniref:class I SAM-dependent DNA methyltransferase n=1 Tax=Clostridium sp. TaxID=1506 RepID=UPI00284337E7|nr:methyltransferase domain-containing protein [Clostridium sp.]MDR3598327.1 methyltransferase domain-containing protein [Clostridium sp.]
MNFDDVAREWDNEKRIERAKIIADKIKTTIGVGQDKSVMEFGCGTGLISFNLYNKFKNITLIDTSKEMINVVNSKIEALNINNVNACCEDLVNTESDKKFDIIYSSMALHHIIDINELSKKFYDMINLNGTLCIVDLNKDDGSFHKNEIGFNGHNGFSKTWLKNVLEVNGFSNIKYETFYKGIKEIDNNKLEYSLFIMTCQKN